MKRESLLLSIINKRAEEFKPVSSLDSLFDILHGIFEPAEIKARKAFDKPIALEEGES